MNVTSNLSHIPKTMLPITKCEFKLIDLADLSFVNIDNNYFMHFHAHTFFKIISM